jgi:DNA-binding transcriptional LysR family regulator
MSSPTQLVTRLRFKHLSLLVALDEHRNLHRAAEAVHLAQPSATKLLRSLEAVLGFPLFERLPRGMHPTALGAEVLRFACRTLCDLERFVRTLDNKLIGGDGQLVIGTGSGAASEVVARVIAAIKTTKPAIAMMSEAIVHDHLRAGLLIRLNVGGRRSLRSFGILSRRGERLSIVADEFRRLIRDRSVMGERDSLPLKATERRSPSKRSSNRMVAEAKHSEGTVAATVD